MIMVLIVTVGTEIAMTAIYLVLRLRTVLDWNGTFFCIAIAYRRIPLGVHNDGLPYVNDQGTRLALR